MWFLKRNEQMTAVPDTKIPEIIEKNIAVVNKVISDKSSTCGAVDILTKKLPVKKNRPDMNADNNAVTVIGITVFLIILVLNAVLDVLKVKEEERARRKLNPDGERRQSLAEFANKKSLRRESSKFGLQLFQIAESFVSTEENKNNRRQSRPVTRGESTNSYLSEKKAQGESAPASVGEVGEPKLVKRQSVAKLFGGRPSPMVRRSSFPVLPLNPEVQALMLGHKQASFDSDDESDGKGRRVRIIRRY